MARSVFSIKLFVASLCISTTAELMRIIIAADCDDAIVSGLSSSIFKGTV